MKTVYKNLQTFLINYCKHLTYLCGVILACVILTSNIAIAQCFETGVFELSDLDGSNGFTINGIDEDDQSGVSVSSAGDINGDGFDDILIGAMGADPNGNSYAGESYVVFGKSTGFSSSVNLSNLNGNNGFVINGIDAHDYSGVSVSTAGDVNGDGFDDMIIGAHYADPNGNSYAGESYVIFGKNTGFSSSVNLSDLNGSNGFVINGIDADDFNGWSVSIAGDVNGDGLDDVIIGAPYANPNGNSLAGESYVVFGKSTSFSNPLNLNTLNGNNGFVINGIDPFDFSGRFVSTAGDVNGDGLDDIIIGALGADPNGDSYAGESYVVFGKSTGFSNPFNLSTLNGSNGFVINGIDTDDNSGFSVSTAGDVNGDGFDDIIIGAYGADPNGDSYAGESYVVFGKNTSFSSSFNLSDLNGSNGFVIIGIDADDYSGWSVSTAGDVNGDGLDDMIIGAYQAGSIGSPNTGESYVVFGNNTGFSHHFNLSTLNGCNGFVINGIDGGDISGHSVSSAGDVNGDGINDMIIGAYLADPNVIEKAGESYVVFGCVQERVGNFEESVCTGATVTVNGIAYMPGSYTQDLVSVYGCDSTLTIVISELLPTSASIGFDVCTGETQTVNGTAYTIGTHTETLTNVAGCDSTLIIVIGELFPTFGSLNFDVCSGETQTVNGTVYPIGTHIETLTNVAGCDSILTINISTTPSINLDITFDGFPGQTSWDIIDVNDNVVASGNNYGSNPGNSSIIETTCLPDGCYTLNFHDALNNGMCPFQSSAIGVSTFITPGTLITPGIIVGTLSLVATPGLCGNYTLTDANASTLVTGGGNFGTEDMNSFCIEDGLIAPLPPRLTQSENEIQKEVDSSLELLTDHFNNTIPKHSPLLELSIAPNPASNYTMITYQLEQPQVITFTMFNLNGKMVHSIDVQIKEAGLNQQTLNVNHLPKGMYVLQVKGNNWDQFKELIIAD